MALALYLTLPSTRFLNTHIKFASGLSSFQDQHMHSCMQPEALRHCFGSSLWGMSSHELPSESKFTKAKEEIKKKNQTRRTNHWALKLVHSLVQCISLFQYLSSDTINCRKMTSHKLCYLQCTCHWCYAQVCKSLFHFSRRNATVWDLHLPCINRDAELCCSRVSTATDLCQHKAWKHSSLPALF